MAALSAPRNTKRFGDSGRIELIPITVKGSTKIYQGALVVWNAGYAAPGTAATGLVAAGRAETTVDNSSGADGALTIEVRRGTFPWDNSATDPVVVGDLGKVVYIEDDHTVCHTSTGKSVAGILLQFENGAPAVET